MCLSIWLYTSGRSARGPGVGNGGVAVHCPPSSAPSASSTVEALCSGCREDLRVNVGFGASFILKCFHEF